MNCPHGAMEYKSGTNKKGKDWSGYFCPAKVCDVAWDKPGKPASVPQAAPRPVASTSTGPPTDAGVGRRIAALQAAATIYQGSGSVPIDAVLHQADAFARWLGQPTGGPNPTHPDDRGEMP